MDDKDVKRDDATVLMAAAAAGDRTAAERLLPLVYDQLRRAAQVQMGGERRGHTLSATALVHEAYMKLAGPREVPWQGRGHFYAAAAAAMRQILVDHARAKGAAIRGGPEAKRAAVELSSLPDLESSSEAAGFLILDEAIGRLEGADAEAAAVVRLRYFAGLSVEEAAVALGVSAATVKRAWTFARAWLRESIEAGRD
jgi:RNA polymerase sigma factor (TIGR02999 family)